MEGKELSSDGALVMREFDKQKEFVNAVYSGSYSFILFGGAIRGGKTVISLGLLITLCKIFPKSKYIVVRKSLQRIRDTVLPTFYSIRPDNFTAQDPSQGNSWEWMGTNGSIIKFYAENIEKDPDLKRFRGLEADGFLFEEMDISEKTFFVGFERTGTWMMKERKEAKDNGKATPPSLVLGTSNPQGGWVKRLIYDKWVKGTLNPKWHYIQSRVYDNPSVSEEWIKSQQENLTPERFELMINGDWSANENNKPFFHHFMESKHKSTRLKRDGNNLLTLSFDFNFSPVSCLVGQKLIGKGCFFYFSYTQENGGTEGICKDQLSWIKEQNINIEITGDNNGHSNKNTATTIALTDYQVLEDFFNTPASGVTYSANSRHHYSRALCNQVLYKVPCYFDEVGCAALIQQMKEAETNDRGNLDKSKADHHLVDCFRYMINLWFSSIEEVNDFAREVELVKNHNKKIDEQIEVKEIQKAKAIVEMAQNKFM